MNGRLTVTVLPVTGRDQHGDPITGPSRTVTGVTLQPRAEGNEDVSEGHVVVVGLTMTAPFETVISGEDQVRVDEAPWAGTYDVIGEPGYLQSPFTGRRSGVVVALSKHGGT